MAIDLNFKKLVENLSNRSEYTKSVQASFNDMEDRWQKTLEAGDAIDIHALKEELKNDSGVITKTVFSNMSKTLEEAAGYLDIEFRDIPELPSMAAYGIFNENTKLKEIPYYKYNTEAMDKIVNSMKADSRNITTGLLDLVRLMENKPNDLVGDDPATKEAALKIKSFLDLVKSNDLFKPRSVVERSLSTDYIYAGDAVIKQNMDRVRYKEFCDIVKTIPEKLRILAARFNKPEVPNNFFEMSENCRYLHLKVISMIESLTSRVLAMSYNLKCIKDTFVENYKSLNDAIIAFKNN